MNVPGGPRFVQREGELSQEVERPEQARLKADHPFMALDLAIAGQEIADDVPARIEHDSGEIEEQHPAPDPKGAR
jgi:hypothetical protein